MVKLGYIIYSLFSLKLRSGFKFKLSPLEEKNEMFTLIFYEREENGFTSVCFLSIVSRLKFQLSTSENL